METIVMWLGDLISGFMNAMQWLLTPLPLLGLQPIYLFCLPGLLLVFTTWCLKFVNPAN